jgi:hypothetical protein
VLWTMEFEGAADIFQNQGTTGESSVEVVPLAF